MLRILIAVALIVHGLAHAGAGMWAHDPVWLATLGWWLATIAFALAGLRLLGVRLVPLSMEHLIVLAVVGSVTLTALFPSVLTLPAILIDLLFVSYATQLETMVPGSAARHRAAQVLGAAFLVYASAVILLRPSFMRWGTTTEDRTTPLIGDRIDPSARYILNHAVTVRAPVDSVWPWLAQIGQDRAGFYSFSSLERLVGARITNADSIVPAWQRRQVGDLVRATQPEYLGGIFGRELGWRIVAMDSGRGFVLENWGAFTVRPIDDGTTRLQIRQRNPGRPTLMGTVFAPLGLLVLEPAHFIMQQRMLYGIKSRAERRAG